MLTFNTFERNREPKDQGAFLKKELITYSIETFSKYVWHVNLAEYITLHHKFSEIFQVIFNLIKMLTSVDG